MLNMKDVGEPYALIGHVRFDEGLLVISKDGIICIIAGYQGLLYVRRAKFLVKPVG
jgi:hypothetical protein